MSNKIKLRYFDCRGRLEPIRMLLEEAGVEYEEDPQTDFLKWREIKTETPWHQLPIAWDENGKIITQSNAILRHFGRKYSFYGSNLDENLRVDELIEAIGDGFYKAGELYWSKEWKENAEKLNKEFIPNYYGNIEKFFKKDNNGPYLLGLNLSIADIALWCYLDLMKPFIPDAIKRFPTLNQFYNDFSNRDKIANYLKSSRRRKTFTVPIAPMGGTPETSSQP